MTRDTRLDLLKSIAIFGVLLIHICGYNDPIASANWFGSVFWRTLFAAAVPLFLMCSGALLNEPSHELPLKKLWFKNILRILIACFFWAMLYKVYNLHLQHALRPDTLWQACKEVLLFQHEFHFYYIQMILLVYVFLPMSRIFTKHATQKQFLYFLAVWFVLGILRPTIADVWPLPLLGGVANQWWMNMVYASIGYGILGYYLKKYPPKLWVGIVLALFGFLLTFGGTVIETVHKQMLSERFLDGMTVGVACLAAGIFSCCMHVKSAPRPFVYLSKASFCIYLTHMFVIYTLRQWQITVYSFTSWLSAPTIAFAVLLVTLGIYLILSHIPLLKKWLI